MAVNPRRASQGATSIDSESNVSRPPEETLAPTVLSTARQVAGFTDKIGSQSRVENSWGKLSLGCSGRSSVRTDGICVAPQAMGVDLRRAKKELEGCNKDPETSGIKAELVTENDYLHLKGTIQGPIQTPYEGGVFDIDITLPSDYPFEPPKVCRLGRRACSS
jgi:hypothetical protein